MSFVPPVQLSFGLPSRALASEAREKLAAAGIRVPAVRRSSAAVTVALHADEWRAADADLLAFDRRIHGAEDQAERCDCTLVVSVTADCATSFCAVATQVLTRYQRLFPRRNPASRAPRFSAVLTRHAALHDRTKPLVRADHDHALDVWQWLLRLAPKANLALQIAALFHDIERLQSEADVRVEQHAADYGAFKRAHAQVGAELTRRALEGLDLGGALERAVALVARHEQPGGGGELAVLNDADALSFFSLNCAGFLAYYGAPHTALKVRYTLDRMSSRARALLPGLRLPAAVTQLLADEGALPLTRSA